MYNNIKFVVFLTFLSFLSFGQEKKARELVQVLTADSLHGRGYVLNGVNKAGDFIAQQFELSELRPFFGDTSYFQNFAFDVNTFQGEMSAIRDDYFFIPGKDFLVDEKSGSYHGNLLMLGIDSTIFTEQEKMETALQKIHLGKKNSFFVDLQQFPKKNYRLIARELEQLANIAPLVITTNQKFVWSVSNRQLKFPILYFKDSLIDSKSLLSINIEATLESQFINKNVAGYLPNKKNKSNAKTLVFTAHYDHLGMMGTTPKPTYFPGASDNACGVSMLISLADYFKENPTRYNMLFLAFAGEEAGLLGSRYFVENKTMDLSKIKFLINLDMVGSGEDGITIVNGSIFKKDLKKFQKINDKKNYVKQIKPRGEAANSDHYFFYQSGVPAIFIYTMGKNQNYHDINDVYEDLSFFAYDNLMKLIVDFVKGK